MNKELQDLAWSILPKEFKEEVKEEYFACKHCSADASAMELEIIFGEHNLTSASEGEEELLTVQRSKVIDIFTQNTILLSEGHSEYLSGYYNGKCHVLKDLFGSKGLPDELNEDNFAKSEPKFHKGDKVEVINYDFGLPSLSRCVHEVFTVSDVKYNANQWMYKLETNKWLFNERGYLESIQWCEHFLKAYKEPNPAEEDDVFNDPEPKCLHFKDGKCAHPAVAHLENGRLAKGADCDVSSCEDVEYKPKPAEPKFKEGDRAIIKARVVNVRQRSGSTLFNTLFNYDIRLDDGRTVNWVDEQWLLPDNDDQVRAVTKKDSERFDKILAKDLRKEKRLRIATQIMAAMMSNPVLFNKSITVEYEDIVHDSMEYADALIEAVEKGGSK